MLLKPARIDRCTVARGEAETTKRSDTNRAPRDQTYRVDSNHREKSRGEESVERLTAFPKLAARRFSEKHLDSRADVDLARNNGRSSFQCKWRRLHLSDATEGQRNRLRSEGCKAAPRPKHLTFASRKTDTLKQTAGAILFWMSEGK
jgi:hypothetical protein